MKLSFSYAGACLIASMFLCGDFASCYAAEPGKDSAKTDSERVERLIRQLRSDDFQQRVRAAEELVSIGAPALEPLRRATKDDDPEVRRWAEKSIPMIELNLKVEGYVAALKSRRVEERRHGASELREMDPPARGAVPALVEALDDTDQVVRDQVMLALSHVGADAQPAVAKLVTILRDGKVDLKLRGTCAYTLGRIGPAAEPAVPALLEALAEDNPRLQLYATRALGRIRSCKDDRVLPALFKALRSSDRSIPGFAVEALLAIGKDKEKVVVAIRDVLKRHRRVPKDSDVRPGILSSLADTGPPETKAFLPELLEILDDPKEHEDVMTPALYIVGSLGSDGKEAVPVLRRLLKTKRDQEKSIRWALEAIQAREK